MGGNRTESTAVVCAKCIGVCVCMCVCCVCVCAMCERGISFDSEVIQTLYTVTNMLVCARASVCMQLSVCVCERENPQNCKQHRGLCLYQQKRQTSVLCQSHSSLHYIEQTTMSPYQLRQRRKAKQLELFLTVQFVFRGLGVRVFVCACVCVCARVCV